MWRRWRKKLKNEDISFTYTGALCELPESAEELSNGFFVWKSDFSKSRELMREVESERDFDQMAFTF